MTVVGIDDTDSRERGMCTTYVATQVAERLRQDAAGDGTAEGASTDPVARVLLVRLNPAVEYKTRGNAALAIHTDCDADRAFAIARERLESLAVADDDRTNPGLVVADHGFDPPAIPDDVARFTERAIRDHLEPADAVACCERHEYRTWHAGNGRGRIGALAAIGGWRALEEWTDEHIAYRDSTRWGTAREVDHESVFAAAEWGYPDVWDTVDRGEDETVCVPHTPGPILYGIRGDDLETVRRVADRIESEPVETSQSFVTNQGTDVHLREGSIATVRDGHAYRLTGRVASSPETRRGGHVFVELEADDGSGGNVDGIEGNTDGAGAEADDIVDETDESGVETAGTGIKTAGARSDTGDEGSPRLTCAAFEPTKRFRDRVRALRVGDRIAACGEVASGTLKLEKFAVRELVTTERVTPTCPDCERTMESAGRDQGYRCRDCETTAPSKVTVPLERDLEDGWYEVPPCARRHVATPLIRGGFDAPIHPER